MLSRKNIMSCDLNIYICDSVCVNVYCCMPEHSIACLLCLCLMMQWTIYIMLMSDGFSSPQTNPTASLQNYLHPVQFRIGTKKWKITARPPPLIFILMQSFESVSSVPEVTEFYFQFELTMKLFHFTSKWRQHTCWLYDGLSSQITLFHSIISHIFLNYLSSSLITNWYKSW